MKKVFPSSSSSSPSPPLPHPNNSSSSSEVHSRPAVIPLDYNYQTMAPSSDRLLQRPFSTTSHTPLNGDAQYSSLFGDPVPPPPPEDFFLSQFPDAIHFARRPSMIRLGSDEEAEGSVRCRLFPETPFISNTRRLSSTVFAPRLQPPDIQILPNSSGGSSSEPAESPNSALLAPDDIFRHPGLYERSDPAEAAERSEPLTFSGANDQRELSTVTRRVSNISEDFKSNVGSLGSPPPEVPALPSRYTRQFSTESYSSSEWFYPSAQGLSLGRSVFPEFSKMPCLRPSSKNVMSIKQDEMPMHQSPVAAMINDSNGSSSGEERVMSSTVVLDQPSMPLSILTSESPPPQIPTDPFDHYLPETETGLLLSPQPLAQHTRGRGSIDSDSMELSFPLPPVPPPPAVSPPQSLQQSAIPPQSIPEETEEALPETESLKNQTPTSPVVMKEAIAIGGSFRIDQARLHKKSAFTIISGTTPTPQSSRAQTPVSVHQKSLISPFLGFGFKDQVTPTKFSRSATRSASPEHQLSSAQKSLSATELQLPQIKQRAHVSSDAALRPSVQFYMADRPSPSKIPHKGILQHRPSAPSAQDQTTALLLNLQKPPKDLPFASTAYAPKMKSCEPLPLISDPYRTSLPRLNRSSVDVLPEPAAIPPGSLPRPIHPNPNPTRKHPGLLRVINSADSLSRIPLRSNWASMEDLSAMQNRRRSSLSPLSGQLKMRRRSSSTSPERRSSTQTVSDRRSSNLSSITTSDFSFRRPSITAKMQERPVTEGRKSALVGRGLDTQGKFKPSLGTELSLRRGNRTPRNRIAKPTTLSPIMGTPNKESSTPQSSSVDRKFPPSDAAAGSASRRGSLSKIPVRNESDSRPHSRLSSHAGSRRESRSSSPIKDWSPGMQLPLSGLTSHAASSRSLSRATIHTESQASSRANSRTPSRSTSRASTRPVSRGPSSRPSSRIEETTSHFSKGSAQKATSVSPSNRRIKANSPQKTRKSSSLSPQPHRKISAARRKSLSPDLSKKKSSLRKSNERERRNSRSMIPTRATNNVKQSAGLSVPGAKPKTRSPIRNSFRSKEPSSAKKTPTSVQKPPSNIKRTPSSAMKPPTAVKKQPNSLQRKPNGTSLKAGPSNQISRAQKEKNREASSNARTVLEGTSTTAKAAEKALKKEASALSLKKGGPTVDNKRIPSGLGAVAPATKVTTAKKAALEGGKPASNTDGQMAATPNQAGGPEVVTAPGTESASAQKPGKLRKQDTKLRLLRAGSKLSLLSRKRSDASLGKKPDTETASIAEESDTSGKAAGSGLSTSSGENISTMPAAILEKSQKTLENVQKTVTEATDEIQKTISENLTDLKSLESDMSKGLGGYESAASPTPSVATVVENKGGKAVATSVSRTGTAESGPASEGGTTSKSPAPPSQPIEAAVSVINGAVATASAVLSAATASQSASNLTARDNGQADAATERNYELDIDGGRTDPIADAAGSKNNGGRKEFKIDGKRRSPDGQGGSVGDSGDKAIGPEYLEEKLTADKDNDSIAPKGNCCNSCTKLCMPCRRSRCSRCCIRNKHSSLPSKNNNNDDAESSCGSTTTTKCAVVDEKKPKFWRKFNCCKRKKKNDSEQQKQMHASEESVDQQQPTGAAEQGSKCGKCGLCMCKVFCCQSVNKVKTTTSASKVRPTPANETDAPKFCFCIPYRGRRRQTADMVSAGSGSAAWQDPECGIAPTNASVLEGADAPAAPTREGCCKRLSNCLLCRKKKSTAVGAPRSRAASIQAAPPPEQTETRRKLHADLVEYNSKMKGAIPVLPLYLAWFCVVCNVLVPGLGTLFSGAFCICLGIPRFSHYDSAKARLGAFIINTIVGVAQFFCVLFCFVGWGWSIWWGTIMLKCAKKLSKIKNVERLEKEEEQRQLDQIAASAAATHSAVSSEAEAARQ